MRACNSLFYLAILMLVQKLLNSSKYMNIQYKVYLQVLTSLNRSSGKINYRSSKKTSTIELFNQAISCQVLTHSRGVIKRRLNCIPTRQLLNHCQCVLITMLNPLRHYECVQIIFNSCHEITRSDHTFYRIHY